MKQKPAKTSQVLTIPLVGIALLIGIMHEVQSAPITRAEFGPTAVDFDFGPAAAPTLTDGFMTVSQAAIGNIESNDFVPSNAIDDVSGSGIRFDFAAQVSAVGTDFFSNYANITFSIFDAANTAIESFTIEWTTLPIGSPYDFPYAFIGLTAGINAIAYATIDTPLSAGRPGEIRVDNVVYRQQVPAPATLALIGLGLAAIGYHRRKNPRVSKPKSTGCY